MNKFQENLQKTISELIKVSEIIVSSDKASQLDIDILLAKLRKAYDVAISFELEKQEIILENPIIFTQDLKQEPEVEKKEEFIDQKIEEDIIVEEVPQTIIVENEIEKQNIESIIEDEVEREVEVEKEIEEVAETVAETIIEEKAVQSEQKVIIKPILIEPEILFDTENHEQETNDNARKNDNISKESPSVLKYLNEQMPKVNNIFQEQNQEKKSEENTNINQQSSPKTIGERYSQEKSVLDNISKTVKQDDISSRFKTHNLDLRTAIGVNEKFMFINDLFSGNLRQYTDFIQKLNEAESLEKANQILNATKEENRWISNSLPITTLHEIILKKFH